MHATILILGLFFSNTQAKGDARIHGTKPTLTTTTPLAEALANYKRFENRDILLTGRTGAVCQMKGCWMVFKEGKSEVRVTFKDYGFFVPKDSGEKPVTVQGRLQHRTESVQEQKHYLKDAGSPAEEISAVQKPKEVYSLVATGVVFSK